jgi:hypothetical protein
MLESIGKVNLCIIVVVCMANNQQGTKPLPHQNLKKYEIIVQEIRLQFTQVM